MLKDRLLGKEFYLENMSMFLKDSFGMIDREETYRAILNNVNDIADGIFSRLDILNTGKAYDPNYNIDYFARNNVDKNGKDDFILDMLAAVYGIQRTFNIYYHGANFDGHYGADPDTVYVETVSLTNYELYIYILVIITKLNYQGTAGEIRDLYYNDDTEVGKLQIRYIWNSSAECNVYFNNSDLIYDYDSTQNPQYNSNLVKLFLADKLLVESLGIQYNKFLTMVKFIAIFDTDPLDPESGIPDPANYKYLFDPDFNNQNESGFQYGVFA